MLPQLLRLMENRPGSLPVNAQLVGLICSVAMPLLLRVTVCAPLTEPGEATKPSDGKGVKLPPGAILVPVSGNVCVPPPLLALSTTTRDPLPEPIAEALDFTLIWHDAPGASGGNGP